MNIKFDHTNHKKLWNWLAENPDKDKEDWPEWKKNGGGVEESIRHCFACAYEAVHNEDSCHTCPLIWPHNYEGDFVCDGMDGLWANWYESEGDIADRTKYALQIANLPVKDGVETI